MDDFIPPNHNHHPGFRYVGLGNKGQMLGSQGKAYENHSDLMSYLKTDIFLTPPFRPALPGPPAKDELSRVNLPGTVGIPPFR